MFSRVRDEDIVKIKDQLLDLDVIVKCLYINIHIETRGVELVELVDVGCYCGERQVEFRVDYFCVEHETGG